MLEYTWVFALTVPDLLRPCRFWLSSLMFMSKASFWIEFLSLLFGRLNDCFWLRVILLIWIYSRRNFSQVKTVKEATAVCRSFLDGVVIFFLDGTPKHFLEPKISQKCNFLFFIASCQIFNLRPLDQGGKGQIFSQ